MKKWFATVLMIGLIGSQGTPLAAASASESEDAVKIEAKHSFSWVQNYYAKRFIYKEVIVVNQTQQSKPTTTKKIEIKKPTTTTVKQQPAKKESTPVATTPAKKESTPVATTPVKTENTTAATPKVEKSTTNQTSTISAFEQEVVNLTNAERAKAGLKALEIDTALMANAREKSEDMRANGYFDHTSPTLGTPFEQMKKRGITYKAAGENIAKGQTTPKQVVEGWMNSSGHRANIMSESFTHIGVGYVAGGHHWTQQFIKK